MLGFALPPQPSHCSSQLCSEPCEAASNWVYSTEAPGGSQRGWKERDSGIPLLIPPCFLAVAEPLWGKDRLPLGSSKYFLPLTPED